MSSTRNGLSALFVSVALAASASAATSTYSFARVSPFNASQNPAAQFGLSITDPSSTQVAFTFTNNVGIASSISEIYFDSAQVFLGAAALTQTGTNFAAGGANPGNLPGGNNLSPAFNAVSIYSADATGNPSNGNDQASDSLVMTFTLAQGQTYNSIISAINSGAMRIGIHVRAIGSNGQSDAFVNIVPTPAAASVLGMAGIVATRRRRR